MSESSPTVVVLAGPNGAGKTTAARTLLGETLQLLTFVNADVIAQGLSGFAPEAAAVEASRIMLHRLHQLADRREDFAFETTLAARTLAVWLRELRATGYTMHLIYFWLGSADTSVERVALRVSRGGHHVPEATIRQRYERSIRNFFTLYRPLANSWEVYDNSHAPGYQLVAHGNEATTEVVVDKATWERFKGGLQ